MMSSRVFVFFIQMKKKKPELNQSFIFLFKRAKKSTTDLMKLLLPSVVFFRKKEQSLWVPEREQTHVVNIRREPVLSRRCSSSCRGPSLLVFVIPSWLFSSNNTKRWVVCPLIPLCQPNFCLCVCVFVPGARAHSPRLSESIKKENI